VFLPTVRSTSATRHDVVIVGSGVGGAAAANVLVRAGLRVLMLEWGSRVQRGGHNWASDAVLLLSPHYTTESPYLIRGDDRGVMGSFHCVGGQAVFFGGVALRMREWDFDADPDISQGRDGAWPFGYDTLEPYYAQAEELLEVAGDDTSDPTAPWRATPYPHTPAPLQGPALPVRDAARRLGLTPVPLPLAIRQHEASSPGKACVRCGTCDGYACAIEAKRDPSTAILPALEARGLILKPNTVVVRLLRRGDRVLGVECVDRTTGRHTVEVGGQYVLAAGALASPRLVLASGLHASSPAGEWVGRCLMRHCNSIVYGVFKKPLEGARAFHKQIGIMDLYGGNGRGPKLGCIQSIHPPPPGLVRARAPALLGRLAEPLADRCTGLLSIAEDQPRPENGVTLDPRRTDRFGVPLGVVEHRYTWRDVKARLSLTRVARAVLLEAGAAFTFVVRIGTFSHALGTLRMGADPRTSPLDPWGRFRGLDNLWVADGSVLPRAGGVNPSLTIAAAALRTAERLAGVRRPSLTGRRRERATEPVRATPGGAG